MKKDSAEYYNPVYGYFGNPQYNDGIKYVGGSSGDEYSSLKGYYSAMD
jgi:hypothetical protein